MKLPRVLTTKQLSLDCRAPGVQIPIFGLALGHFIHTLVLLPALTQLQGSTQPTQEQSSPLVNLILLEVCSEFMPQVAVRWSEAVPSASDGYKKDMQSDVHLSKYITKLNDYSFTKLIKNGTKR